MAAEFYRKQYGETEAGYVVVIGKRNADGDSTYEVRRGAHTISTFDTEAAADALASALVPASVA